jgi:hypothetical protein
MQDMGLCGGQLSHIDVKEYLDLAAQRNGYMRQSYEDRKVPQDFNDVSVMPLFGDFRHIFIASALLLRRYREEAKGSKYFILMSWPGFRAFFPYVDEFWSPSDEEVCKKLWKDTDGFCNKSKDYTINLTNLHESFREVLKPEVLREFNDNGVSQEFWDRFRHIKVWLPQVSSQAILGKEFTREVSMRPGFKVVVLPTLVVEMWKYGRTAMIPAPKEFWVALVKHLKESGFTPVVVRTFQTHDISQETHDDAIHLADPDLAKLLAAIRSCGCLLDVFNGTSRLAIAARTPYLCCDERSRFFNSHDYEVDDLCGRGVPREYLYGFSSICQMPPPYWEHVFFRHVTMKLNDFLPELDRDRWPTTTESYQIVPYESVRKIKRRKLGTKLLKIIRD